MRRFRRRLATALPIVSMLLVAGCGNRVIHIESDTDWSGTIDGIGVVSGRGSRTFALDAVSSPVCWTITKMTDAGTLSQAVDTTDAAGKSSVTWTMGDTPGVFTATATVADLPIVTFTASASLQP
jgi:hypothetical protein